MIIQLTKAVTGKPGILKCIRDDRTATWQPSTPYFAFHDLIHYAVETTLGYSEAFYGVIARGKDLEKFGTRQGKKDTYTCQEAWAESLVGLLQWPGVVGGIELTEDEFFQQLTVIFADQECAAPEVRVDQLYMIKQVIRELHEKWRAVEPGETLELEFE